MLISLEYTYALRFLRDSDHPVWHRGIEFTLVALDAAPGSIPGPGVDMNKGLTSGGICASPSPHRAFLMALPTYGTAVMHFLQGQDRLQ